MTQAFRLWDTGACCRRLETPASGDPSPFSLRGSTPHAVNYLVTQGVLEARGLHRARGAHLPRGLYSEAVAGEEHGKWVAATASLVHPITPDTVHDTVFIRHMVKSGSGESSG